jgi:serine O-acetyltransferase
VVIGETAEIGDDCTLYHGVTLGGTTWNKGKRHPTLGNGVVVGAGAKILGAIAVGDGANVGANSVVVKEVPPGRTAIGIPARLVGGRSKVGAVGTAGMAINLDHHLIPDPVGKAIQCLLERIEALEAGLRPDARHPRPRPRPRPRRLRRAPASHVRQARCAAGNMAMANRLELLELGNDVAVF